LKEKLSGKKPTFTKVGREQTEVKKGAKSLVLGVQEGGKLDPWGGVGAVWSISGGGDWERKPQQEHRGRESLGGEEHHKGLPDHETKKSKKQ